MAVDAATGAVTYTPGADAYGTTKTATVVVTYSDDTTDEATVTFNVEKSNAQKYNVLYPAVSGRRGRRAQAHRQVHAQGGQRRGVHSPPAPSSRSARAPRPARP